MKTLKKIAREHNINKVMQELTAAELRIDHEESFKKIIIKKYKIAIKTIRKKFIPRSRFFGMNVKFQLPNQWFRNPLRLQLQNP